jgi:FkbM family methyltransferase
MTQTAIPQEELEVFSALPDLHVVFDVGAREDLEMYKRRPEVTYHCFEPNPTFAEKLKGIPNVIVNEFGLSDVREDNVTYYDNVQSFIKHPFIESQEIGNKANIRTLDEYAKDIPRIDFIKIDTEGMDYRVLLGGAETIKRARFIQFEYWDGSRKFYDLLNTDFNLYLMMEETLRKTILDNLHLKNPNPGDEQLLRECFNAKLIAVDADVIKFIDTQLVPNSLGGNILCVHK